MTKAYILNIFIAFGLLASCDNTSRTDLNETPPTKFPHQDFDSVLFITLDTNVIDNSELRNIFADTRSTIINDSNKIITDKIIAKRLDNDAVSELQKIIIPVSEHYTLDCISESLNAFAFYDKGEIISSINIIFPCDNSIVHNSKTKTISFGDQSEYKDLIDYLNKHKLFFTLTKHHKGQRQLPG